jgi:hypothetical protein
MAFTTLPIACSRAPISAEVASAVLAMSDTAAWTPPYERETFSGPGLTMSTRPGGEPWHRGSRTTLRITGKRLNPIVWPNGWHPLAPIAHFRKPLLAGPGDVTPMRPFMARGFPLKGEPVILA